jgi:hypothetical protein
VPTVEGDAYLDENSIPAFLEEATSELAMSLIESDITQTPDDRGYSEIKVGTLSLKMDDLRNRPDQMPDSVSNIITPYLEGDVGGVDLVRS